MSADLFESSQLFKKHFIRQLEQMLEHDEIGVFILVLANASMLPEIHRQLYPALAEGFQRWSQRLQQASATDLQQLPADDVKVFRLLTQTGFDNLQLTRNKNLGIWLLQYNQLRSFRPPRNSDKREIASYQAFDHKGFHFNQAFLRKEILWQGELNAYPLRLLYNKYPFAEYHGLLLIEPELQKPQFLQAEDCSKIRQLLDTLTPLSGLGLAYNSLGAYASVNHQHWQLFLSSAAYPVELIQWSHNGGSLDYPLGVSCFASISEAWPMIERFQQQQIAFNILCRQDRTYLVRRRSQGQYTHSNWTSGFAWSEIMGRMTLGNQEDFSRLGSSDIETEYQRLKL